MPWLVVAIASVAIPWTLYREISGEPLSDALAPKVMWAALWPILIGGLLAIALRRWEHLLPRIPEGDVLAADEFAVRGTLNLGAAMERIERYLRQWPVAGMLFLALTVILAGILLTGR